MQGSPVQFQFEDISPVEKRLKVEVAKEHVASKLDSAYRKLSREVNLRGFRKGKAPRELLERMFGARVSAEVLQELLRDSLTYVAQSATLRMIGQPAIEDVPEVRRGQPLRYSARIELFPQIGIQDYDGIEVTRRAPAVTDEQIDEVLERKRAEHTEMIPVEGRETTGATDTVVVSVTGTVGRTEYDHDDLTFDLAQPAHLDRSRIPGLAPALVGLPLSGEEREVRFTMPETGLARELAGKEFTLRVSVRQAYQKRVPELDDEFAKDTGEAETLAELREKIRQDLLKHDEEQVREEVRMAILDEAVRRNPIPLPPSLVKRVAEQNFEVAKRRARIEAMAQGLEPSATEEAVNEPALRLEAEADATRSLSKEFLLYLLADKEQIEVTQADVEKRIAEIARQGDKSVQRVRAEIQREDPSFDNLRSNIRLEKALDLLESRAKIVEAAKP
jgi:trigger factor